MPSHKCISKHQYKESVLPPTLPENLYLYPLKLEFPKLRILFKITSVSLPNSILQENNSTLYKTILREVVASI